MLGHRHPPVGITPVATGPSHSPAAAATVSNWAATNSVARGGRSAPDGGVALVADRGVEYLFANAGTDFAPMIEALAKA